MKTLLVGEWNPYGTEARHALYPYPRGATGHRLASLIMQLSDGEYLRRFDRINLCVGKWSIRAARVEATRVIGESAGRPAIVLLGSKVCAAFGLSFEPFTSLPIYAIPSTSVVILPHPSGLNRMWAAPGALERARGVLQRNGVLE